MQIWNGSEEYCWRYKADTILSTDGQTDKVKLVFPFQLRWSGGYKYLKMRKDYVQKYFDLAKNSTDLLPWTILICCQVPPLGLQTLGRFFFRRSEHFDRRISLYVFILPHTWWLRLCPDWSLVLLSTWWSLNPDRNRFPDFRIRFSLHSDFSLPFQTIFRALAAGRGLTTLESFAHTLEYPCL